MRPYSLDLRKKIIETYEEDNLSQRELATRFRVALSFIQKLIKQWRETGNLNPKSHGGGQKLKLSSDQIILLGDLVKEKNDATLDELRKQIEEKTRTVVSNSTISRILKRLNLTLKKKHYTRVNVTKRESNN
jgi:transposase